MCPSPQRSLLGDVAYAAENLDGPVQYWDLRTGGQILSDA